MNPSVFWLTAFTTLAAITGCEQYRDPPPLTAPGQPRVTTEFRQYGGDGGAPLRRRPPDHFTQRAAAAAAVVLPHRGVIRGRFRYVKDPALFRLELGTLARVRADITSISVNADAVAAAEQGLVLEAARAQRTQR